MRALVTGGTGFIGRRLVRRLADRFGASNVTCVVKAPASKAEADALAAYRTMHIQLIDGDLTAEPVAEVPPPPVDAVFHLAANIDTDASEEESRVNDVGTRRLLDWLAPVSKGARIVYTSSVAVHDRISEPTGPLTETSPFTPRTAYGRTKLAGEHILRERADRDRFSWTILRLPTVYGPGQKTDGLFDQLIRRATNGAWLGRIDWPGRTSVVYVDDVADAMIDLAATAAASDEVYCIASDDEITVGELARRVALAVGRRPRPIAIPRPLVSAARAIVWNSAVQRLVPPFARLPFWRFSLVISDGFWFDATKFRRAYTKRLRTLDEGLAETLGA